MSTAGVRRLSAREVAALTGGRLIGSPDAMASALAPLQRADAGDLTFLAGHAYLKYLQHTTASVVLLREEHAGIETRAAARVVVDDPRAALLAVVPVLYASQAWTPGIDPTATVGRGTRWDGPIAIGAHTVIGAGVQLGRNVRIGPGCVVGEGAVVGDDTHLYARVTCYPGTVLGRRVVLHAGVAIGVEGFGYARDKVGGEHRRIPHIGKVLIGDDVEIGANTTIDRGSVDDTVIGAGTKIDNLVQIAHNVHIGARCLVMSQVGIAGSTTIEDDVIIAGQVGIGDHVVIGAGAGIGAQSGVVGDVAAGQVVFGYPARDKTRYLRAQAALYRLAELVHKLEALVERDR